ncbi:diguanylate cyclase [Azospirillum thermophilum]|uniref:diguanylate cyclase n=1 Tax=Azospirillum thermophilum TaxID=2202148 RepID=UPI00143DCB8E|nr:diguanylate cyclase [Azospirillum thermophilum]
MTAAMVMTAVAALMVLISATRKSYPGFRLLSLGHALLAIGFILSAFRDGVPSWLPVIVANYLILTSAALKFDGICLFYDGWSARSSTINHAVSAVATLVLGYFLYIDPNINARITAVSSAYSVILARTAAVPFRQKKIEISAVDWVIPFAHSLLIVILGWRTYMAATSDQIIDFINGDLLFRLTLMAAILAAFMSFAAYLMLAHRRIERELIEARNQAETLSRTDSLTGCWNRRHFEEQLQREFERAARYGTAASLLIFDIDHFKAVNDGHGHDIGDVVLEEVAGRMRHSLRATDLLCRWGGEEFAILVPTPLPKARALAEKIRARIAEEPVAPVGSVTVSAGVAELEPGESTERWMRRADRALYRAKALGRNRVEQDPGEESVGSLDRLQWSASFHSGEPALDAQHKSLFEITNRLMAVGSDDTSHAAAAAIFDVLSDDLRRHFAYEESLLVRIGYKYMDAHKAEHERLLSLIGSIIARHEAGLVSTADAAHAISKDVIFGHILSEDRNYFSALCDAAEKSASTV